MVEQVKQPSVLPFSDRARFESSDVWQAILRVGQEFQRDLVSVCIDNTKDLESIRYAQGGLDAARWFLQVLDIIFEEDK